MNLLTFYASISLSMSFLSSFKKENYNNHKLNHYILFVNNKVYPKFLQGVIF